MSILEGKNYLTRPARKQIDKPFIKDFAYKQGEEEYNIWYDKYLNDRGARERVPAATRCDPEQDVGFTKADLMESERAYFCLHFIRGCCVEGGNCRFLHHFPTIEDCRKVDAIRDIFGRTRHAGHRDDMGGIGCFQKECRTLCVGDIKIPPGNDPVGQVNEMLWRHFGMWGRVQDIMFIPQKCLAFIKYSHRCYAEIAKEAMSNQTLDYDEMLSIKWANDDPNPAKESQYSEAWHKSQIEAEREKKQKQRRRPEIEEAPVVKSLPPPVDISTLTPSAEDLEVRRQAARMQAVLDRISRDMPNTLNEIVYPEAMPSKRKKLDDEA
jgi:hypothetical protein